MVCRNAYAMVFSLAFKYACTSANALITTNLNGKLEHVTSFRHRAQIKFKFGRFGRGQVNGQVQVTAGEVLEKNKVYKTENVT